MPLSKDEQRQLEEIERTLLDEDSLVSAAGDFDRQWTRPAMARWTAFILGMGVVIVGSVAAETVLAMGLIISLIGFSVVIAAAAWMIHGPTRT